MDAFTFLVEMTKALSWPAVTLTVAACARKAGGRPACSFEQDWKSEDATEMRSAKP